MEAYVYSPDGEFRWNHINIIPRLGELVVINKDDFTSSRGVVRDVRYDQWVDGSLKITIFIGEDNNE
jgi:hypothetical protein